MTLRVARLVVLTFSAVIACAELEVTAEELLRRWQHKCTETVAAKGGGGGQFRQCVKEQRASHRSRHAEGLREKLNQELNCFRERQNNSIASKYQANAKRSELTTPPRLEAAKPRPHLLLITTDQQRRDSIGCYSSVVNRELGRSSGFRAQTPHLDRLAAEGVRVDDAWAASPVCAPSRTSLLLGVHVPVHGVYENGLSGSGYSKFTTPFVDTLRAQGYTTALIGKAGYSPIPTGFTHVNVLGEGGEQRAAGTSQYDYLETYLVNCSLAFVLEQDRLEHEYWKKKTGRPPGTSKAPSPGAAHAQVEPKPWFLHLSLASPHPPNTVPTEWPLRYAPETSGSISSSSFSNDNALPLVDFEDGDFEALPLQTQQLQGMVPPTMSSFLGSNSLGSNNDNNNKSTTSSRGYRGLSPSEHWHTASRAFPLHLKGAPQGGPQGGLDASSVRHGRQQYYNQAAFVDDQIGRLLAMLDELGLGQQGSSNNNQFKRYHHQRDRRSLLVIFTSDHGALLHDHGVPDKHTLVGEAARVPLLMRWPGVIPPNTAPLGLASLLDVPATLLAAAGCAPSADGAGFDLVAIARGANAAAAAAAAAAASDSSIWARNHSNSKPRTAVAVTDFFGYGVVTAQWKMMFYPRDNEGRLFHRRSDPHDRINRWRNPDDSRKSSGGSPHRARSSADARTSRGSTIDRSIGNEDNGNDDDEWITTVMLAALLRWRARQEPMGYFRGALTQGLAPAVDHRTPNDGSSRATRARRDLASLIATVRGTDAEMDLMEDLEGL